MSHQQITSKIQQVCPKLLVPVKSVNACWIWLHFSALQDMLQDMLLRLRLLSALRRSRIDCLVKKNTFKDIKMSREPQEIHKFHMRNVEMFLISKEIWRNLTLESHTLQIPTSHARAMHEPCTIHAPAMLAWSHTANAPHPPETYPSPSSSFPEARNVTEYTDRMSKILLSL